MLASPELTITNPIWAHTDSLSYSLVCVSRTEIRTEKIFEEMTKIVAEKYPQTGKFNKIQLREAHVSSQKEQGNPKLPNQKLHTQAQHS